MDNWEVNREVMLKEGGRWEKDNGESEGEEG